MKKKKKKLEPSVASAELGFHRLYMRKLSAASTYIPGYYFSFSFLGCKVCVYFFFGGGVGGKFYFYCFVCLWIVEIWTVL